MAIQLADRVQQIKPSPTFALAARANQLKAAGKDIINLTIGEPDFDTPEHIKEAARRALHDGFTKYTATDGIISLRQAVARKFSDENKLTYQPNQIIVSNGAKQSLYNLTQALLNSGDEVIICAPYWVSYSDMVLLAQAKPVVINAGIEQGFKITAQQLEQAITPRTRLLILNSPSNPTGMVYSQRELTEIAQVLLRHPQIIVASDDIYEHIYWGQEPFANILNVCPELYDRTVVINGVSKAYAMTGWRIGYIAGPPTLISGMSNVQAQSTSNPNSIAQVAAQAALEGDQQCARDMNKAYQERHQVV
jgi:aspartate aminotransferase